MNLLTSIKVLNVNNVDLLQRVIHVLEKRLDWLSDREPESDGEVHDQWEEKYSYIETAFDAYTEAASLINQLNKGKDDKVIMSQIAYQLEEGKDAIEEHQLLYGGLSKISA